METSNYKVTEGTSTYINAIRTLDDGFGQVLDAIDTTYGKGESEGTIAKPFTDKYQELRKEVESLLLESINSNIATLGKMEI